MITLDEYLQKTEEQNKCLLNDMSKYPKNSEIYKLKLVQYQTNLMNIKINKQFGMVMAGQSLNK